ncbi:MAG: DUF402 domain-containing protein [Salinirussus sp.]
MSVRIRGIYATALTRLLDDVVGASQPIRDRFDADFPAGPAAARVTTTGDRQGVEVSGDPGRVESVVDRLRGVGRDALAWEVDLPVAGIYAGRVTDTLGSGAVVDCGDGEGFLPYSESARRIETGDCLRVQVAEPAPPWEGDRPLLATTIRVPGALAGLVRGDSGDEVGTDRPDMADVLPVDPREGWVADWGPASDVGDLDALRAGLERANERGEAIDAALADGPAVDAAPHCYWDALATRWVWFGRESRVALDAERRDVTATMPGHHRIKAGAADASAAVDFAEAVCDPDPDGEFPFDAVSRQFGPREGDEIELAHGKPDGRLVLLGTAAITDCDPGGTIRIEREMSPGGTYDGLGIERRAGDVAITKLTEGKWWYPTVYRGPEGERRGTYVNVCTPVELFPGAARYVDLHVDVVKGPEGTVERVDDDELDAAVAAGHVPEPLAEKAREVAGAVENAL